MTSQNLIPASKRNIIKKERKLEQIQHMRTSLPVLDRYGIKRFRLPYYQALLEELHDFGYPRSQTFLSFLIEYQEEFRKGYTSESPVFHRPRLMYTNKVLDDLYDTFKKAEDAHNKNKIGEEIDEFTKKGMFYGLGPVDWWWLGEQILIKGMSISDKYDQDQGKKKAMLKYLYGKFLLENMENGLQAEIYLEAARKMTKGKSWRICDQTDIPTSVFAECSRMLHNILMAEGKKIDKTDPLQASALFTIAEKRATEICDWRGQANALILHGICKMDLDDPQRASRLFRKVIISCRSLELIDRLCEAKVQLALAYLKMEKSKETFNELNEVLELAEENELPYYVAQANRYIGEFYLNHGAPSTATQFLVKAVEEFHILDDTFNREQAKNLAAISAGQELLPKYVEVILQCDYEKGYGNILQLKRWKEKRELFTIETPESSTKSSTTAFDICTPNKLGGKRVLEAMMNICELPGEERELTIKDVIDVDESSEGREMCME
ncbi:hypothetical protein FQR65_LT13506 [Abscondita terminalis]|nr:hypothetical protein FQR65_LT13506 [Abscondita terminalis]